MQLNSERIALLAEAVRESTATVTVAIATRQLNEPENAAERDLLSNDADLYGTVRNSFVKVKGDGIDFDNARKREAIFYRVRQLLGLPDLVFDLSVEMMTLVELEVGQNFG